MPRTETKVVVFARATFDSDKGEARNRRFFDGITGAEPDYGKVDIVRSTVTEVRAEGDVGRLLDKEVSEEILFTLDTEGATHLLRTLANGLVHALQVQPARRP